MKNLKLFFSIFLLILFVPTFANAFDLSILTPYLLKWSKNNPTLASVIIFMNFSRIFMKPLQALIRAIILRTPTKRDDTLLQKLERNLLFKLFTFLLDWLMSVKIESKKKIERQVNY